LRFGRKVDIKDSAKDSQGKLWVKIAGDYQGAYRQWGWVIRQYLNCGNKSLSSKKIVAVYGYMACPATASMVEALQRNGIPYLFKDTNYSNNQLERQRLADKAGLRHAVPLVYINKNQWIKVGPGPDAVIFQYRNN
jgi:hypothetical protein